MRTFAVVSCVIQAFVWAICFGYGVGTFEKGKDIQFITMVSLFASITNIIAIWVITT